MMMSMLMIVIKGDCFYYSIKFMSVCVWVCVFLNVFLSICVKDSGVFDCVIKLKIFLKEPHFVCALL